MKTLFRFLFLIISMAILNSSCKGPANKTTESEVVFPASIVRSEDLTTQLILPGELEGYYETGIVAKVNGYVKRILVDIGDKVSMGQRLVELEAPELMSQLDGAYSELRVKEAMYMNSKGKLVRLKQTNKTPGAVSPYDMDFAQTTVVADSLSFIASKSKYESVKSLTDYLTIRAPFDGIITERALAPGAFVGPNDKNAMPILRLKNESRLRLHVAIPEKHLAEIKIGDIVRFSVESFPNRLFEGRIARLTKNVATRTRSEMIEVEIINRDGVLLPGMYAHAILDIRRAGLSLVVPETAVVTNMERSFVIKTRQGKAVWVDVRKGDGSNGKMEIFGEIAPGDTVITKGSDEIKNGDVLKVDLADRPVK